MKGLVGSVSADASLHSLSFNEYLTLVSQQRRNGPTESLLLEAFMYKYFQQIAYKIQLDNIKNQVQMNWG